MTQINNSDLTKELIEGSRPLTCVDTIPNQLAEKVVPVMEVNPKLLKRTNFIAYAQATATGNLVFATYPATLTGKKFYVTGIHFEMIKDVTCDQTTGVLSILANCPVLTGSATITILTIPVIALTAQAVSKDIMFPEPLQIDPSTIASTGSYTAGVMVRTAKLYGFTEDNPYA